MTDLIRYNIEHVSRYVYETPAARSVMWLCLEPRNDFDQTLRSFDAQTEPHATLSEESDSFGNNKHVITTQLQARIPRHHHAFRSRHRNRRKTANRARTRRLGRDRRMDQHL